MHRENVFPPLLVKKYRTELFLTYMHIVEKICSRFIENTKENLKSLIQDKNKWSRYFLLFSTSKLKMIFYLLLWSWQKSHKLTWYC